MNRYSLTIVVTLALLSCKDMGVTPKDDGKKEQKAWTKIAQFANYDIRELKVNNNRLYANVVDLTQPEYVGYIFYTDDGDDWKLLFKSKRIISPIAFKEDTIFCFSDSLYQITPNGLKKGLFVPSPIDQAPGDFGDMVLFRDTLYTMQSKYPDAVTTYKITWNGQVLNVPVRPNYSSYGGARFITLKSGNEEKVYVRGQYYKDGFYEFDGNVFIPLRDGLTDDEWYNPTLNSVVIHNGTLFAAFMYPSRIKYLHNNTWYNYASDSLPYSKYAFNFNPILRTQFTGIVFIDGRLFGSTTPLGVWEWCDTAWVQISDGLLKQTIDSPPADLDIYDPIPIFIAFKSTLFAAYGEPASAAFGGKGLFKYKL